MTPIEFFETYLAGRSGNFMEEVERAIIHAALIRFNGHRQRTAEFLGIGVRTLGMKVKQWNLYAVGRKEKVPA